MKLIVGLGNPGSKYRNTYHNVGFMVVDEFAKKNKLRFVGKECVSLTAKGKMNGEEFVVAKPQTFMNLSGEAVKQLMRKYNVSDDELFVVYDDVDLPLGRMRVRYEGSAGTHNGMRNIIAETNITDFKRLRIGTRDEELKNHEVQLIDYVLQGIAYEDKLILGKCVVEGACALEDFVKGVDIERIMAKANVFDANK